MLRWAVRSMLGWGRFGSRVCLNYSSALEMQTTAEAREPPRYVGHFLSVHGRRAAGERERGIEVMNRQSEAHAITSDRKGR